MKRKRKKVQKQRALGGKFWLRKNVGFSVFVGIPERKYRAFRKDRLFSSLLCRAKTL
jgi:hypothetical protein